MVDTGNLVLHRQGGYLPGVGNIQIPAGPAFLQSLGSRGDVGGDDIGIPVDAAELQGDPDIIPIIVGKTAFAIDMSTKMMEKGVFVTGFGFPVVPEGTARIRAQASAALGRDDIEKALEVFGEVGRETGLLG